MVFWMSITYLGDFRFIYRFYHGLGYATDFLLFLFQLFCLIVRIAKGIRIIVVKTQKGTAGRTANAPILITFASLNIAKKTWCNTDITSIAVTYPVGIVPTKRVDKTKK